MRYIMIALISLSLGQLLGAQAFAQQELVDTVQKGCKKELNTYCKKVTPGEGRLLAWRGLQMRGGCVFQSPYARP